MFDDLGVSFAPTAENAMDASRRGAMEGVPQAIQLLSMRLPRVRGAQGISPLVGMEGAQGVDPFLSAVMQSLVKAFSGLPSESMGPGTTAGPNPPGPFQPGPNAPTQGPRVIPIPNPGGDTGKMPPITPRQRPDNMGAFRGKQLR